jgi:hypothetical protein
MALSGIASTHYFYYYQQVKQYKLGILRAISSAKAAGQCGLRQAVNVRIKEKGEKDEMHHEQS